MQWTNEETFHDAVEDEEEADAFFDAMENAGRRAEEDDNEVHALPSHFDSRSRLELDETESDPR